MAVHGLGDALGDKGVVEGDALLIVGDLGQAVAEQLCRVLLEELGKQLGEQGVGCHDHVLWQGLALVAVVDEAGAEGRNGRLEGGLDGLLPGEVAGHPRLGLDVEGAVLQVGELAGVALSGLLEGPFEVFGKLGVLLVVVQIEKIDDFLPDGGEVVLVEVVLALLHTLLVELAINGLEQLELRCAADHFSKKL